MLVVRVLVEQELGWLELILFRASSRVSRGACRGREMDDAAFNSLLGKAYWGQTVEVLVAVDKDVALVMRSGRGGETLLHHACMGRRLELVKGLLARSADKFARNDKGSDALKFAEGDAELVSLLSEKR